MTKQTQSESLFESFCKSNDLDWLRVPVSGGSTPDYRLRLGAQSIAVEIKQVENHDGFNPTGVSSRTVGSHVRHKIEEARKQVQSVAAAGEPAVLLIYNAVDPMQLFGTEPHDFIAAMYGELTVQITRGKLGESFHGRNAKLRHGINTSFSGVGQLRQLPSGTTSVTVYENVYAACPLPFALLPPCIEVVHVSVQDAA